MTDELKGKVALISGAGGGQGRAAAFAFCRAGASVVGCDTDAERAQETVDLVRAAGGVIRSVHPVDVADPAGAARWVVDAVENFGGIDILYNNAGRNFTVGPLADSTLEQWDSTIRNELTIVYVSTMAAWPHLVARGGGVIINTASMSGHAEFRPMRSAAHGATKAGVIALTKMMAAEGIEHGIRAVSISPGMVWSPSIQRLAASEEPARKGIADGIRAKIPMGRAAACEEIASVALFLASPGASYINGADILVDGGMVAVSR